MNLVDKNHDFTNPVLNSIKRNLSIWEKNSVPSISGRQLIMPGAISETEDHESEVEEMIDRGFNPLGIVCVERDADIAEQFYSTYIDGPPIHIGDVGWFLSTSRCKYSYIHLDFCTQLKEESEMQCIAFTKDSLDTVARLRVTVSNQRLNRVHQDKLLRIRNEVMIGFIHSASEKDLDNPKRWLHLINEIRSNTEPTQIIAFIYLITHFFGVDYMTYDNICKMDKAYFPEVQGNHIISSLQRWKYTNRNTNMETIWADFFTFDNSLIANNLTWVLNHVYGYFLEMISEQFTFNPELQIKSSEA